MCENCQKRQRTYDWVRNPDGTPRLTKNGSYVMQNEDSAYYGFTIDTLDQVRALLNEIENLDQN